MNKFIKIVKEIYSYLPIAFAIIIAYSANYVIFNGMSWSNFWYTTLVIYVTLVGYSLYSNQVIIHKISKDIESLKRSFNDDK